MADSQDTTSPMAGGNQVDTSNELFRPGFVKEPTVEQCSNQEKLGDGIYACWYPQMGGYVGKTIVMIEDEPDGCFEAWVWHDGEFPFEDDGSSDYVKHIHHCMASQFIRFGEFVQSKQIDTQVTDLQPSDRESNKRSSKAQS